jgi:hypothetical protein
MAAAPAAVAPELWKSYGEYFAGNPDAAKYSNYHSSYLPGQTKPQKWGASGDPYRFAEEYNQYKTTLPKQYQDLINFGISPEQIKSGAVHSVLTPSGIQKIQGADYYQANPLTSAAASAPAPAPASAASSAPTAPTRPTGRNVTWQQDQQYWRDMDAYRKAGGK